MYATRSACCSMPNREAGGPLIAMALVLAGAALVASMMDSWFDSTLVMVVATVLAGMLVNGKARVPGTPMIAAWIMAPAVVLSGAVAPAAGVPLGSVFMALLLAVMSGSRSVAVVVSIFLASVEVIARLI